MRLRNPFRPAGTFLMRQAQRTQGGIRLSVLLGLSAIVEKNADKVIAELPFVLSSRRIAYLAVAFSWCFHVIRTATMGWPEVTLAVFLVSWGILEFRTNKMSDAAFQTLLNQVISKIGTDTPSSTPPAAVAVAVAPQPDAPPDTPPDSSQEAG